MPLFQAKSISRPGAWAGYDRRVSTPHPPRSPHAAPPWPLELDATEVERRLRWGRERGHPGFVWPEVSVDAWRAALREIEEVAREVLGGGRARLEPRDPPELRALGVAAFTSGTGPLLGWWIDSGAVSAGGSVASLLRLHLAHGRARAERSQAALVRAAEALAEAGIRPLVIKGGHTGRVHFPEPGTRPAADVDLVVGPERFAEAEGALAAAGFTPTGRQLRPLKSDWLAPGSSDAPRSLEVAHAESQYALDLHSVLDRNFFGVRTVGLPGARTRPAPELGAPVDVLEQPALLALLALHASEGLHGLTLVRLVELALVARRDRASGALDGGNLLRLLDRAGARRFVYPALVLTEKLAPGTFEPALLEAVTYAATPRMRRVVEGLRPADAHRPEELSLRDRFMWCDGPADHLRRALHMLLPAPAGRSPGKLAAIYGERVRRVARGRVVRRSG